jgi:hypothetical protein
VSPAAVTRAAIDPDPIEDHAISPAPAALEHDVSLKHNPSPQREGDPDHA